MKKKIFFLILLSIQFLVAFSFDFEQYIINHKNDSCDVFIKDFPYTNYLSVYQIDNIAILEKHRKNIVAIGQNGDDFIYSLFENYIKQNPFSSDYLIQLTATIQLGIVYLNTDKNIFVNTSIFSAVGDLLISESVHFIEKELENGNMKINDPNIEYLIAKVEKNNFFVKYTIPDSNKFFYHLKNKNWSYLWTKAKSRCKDHKYVCGTILILFITLTFFIFRKILKRKNNKK